MSRRELAAVFNATRLAGFVSLGSELGSSTIKTFKKKQKMNDYGYSFKLIYLSDTEIYKICKDFILIMKMSFICPKAISFNTFQIKNIFRHVFADVMYQMIIVIDFSF